MVGARAGLLVGALLTLLWLGSVLASLEGRATLWSERFPPLVLHLLAGILVAAILVNLLLRRGKEGAPE